VTAERKRPVPPSSQGKRCDWAKSDLAIAYHDQEWGVPVHDDRVLFEFLILEGAQAGLSWETILRKRKNYRAAFDQFDPAAVAGYGQKKIEKLLADPGIVRNRLKIAASVQNARCFLDVQKEFGSFDAFVWTLAGGKPKINRWKSLKEIPASTPMSDSISRELRRREFKFVGTTILYAFMQATGIVNDHLIGCFRYREVGEPEPLSPPQRGERQG
jgi:DNA-3-methyladenine glycosylase I